MQPACTRPARLCRSFGLIRTLGAWPALCLSPAVCVSRVDRLLLRRLLVWCFCRLPRRRIVWCRIVTTDTPHDRRAIDLCRRSWCTSRPSTRSGWPARSCPTTGRRSSSPSGTAATRLTGAVHTGTPPSPAGCPNNFKRRFFRPGWEASCLERPVPWKKFS